MSFVDVGQVCQCVADEINIFVNSLEVILLKFCNFNNMIQFLVLGSNFGFEFGDLNSIVGC